MTGAQALIAAKHVTQDPVQKYVTGFLTCFRYCRPRGFIVFHLWSIDCLGVDVMLVPQNSNATGGMLLVFCVLWSFPALPPLGSFCYSRIFKYVSQFLPVHFYYMYLCPSSTVLNNRVHFLLCWFCDSSVCFLPHHWHLSIGYNVFKLWSHEINSGFVRTVKTPKEEKNLKTL